MTGTSMATIGVLLRNALPTAVTGNSRAFAARSVVGSPTTRSMTRLIAPVRYMPSATTNRTTTDRTPVFENPSSASPSGARPSVRIAVRAPANTAHVGSRSQMSSAKRTTMTARVSHASTVIRLPPVVDVVCPGVYVPEPDDRPERAPENGVEIGPDEDVALVLAATVALDQMTHDVG